METISNILAKPEIAAIIAGVRDWFKNIVVRADIALAEFLRARPAAERICRFVVNVVVDNKDTAASAVGMLAGLFVGVVAGYGFLAVLGMAVIGCAAVDATRAVLAYLNDQNYLKLALAVGHIASFYGSWLFAGYSLPIVVLAGYVYSVVAIFVCQLARKETLDEGSVDPMVMAFANHRNN